MARTRIKFDLKARIRDHHDCPIYEKCLDFAAELNRPRVCIEQCGLFVPPHPCEALIIAECLDDWRERHGEAVDSDD